jgi:hypothetical protein
MAFDSDVLVKGAAAGATTEINSQRSRLKGFVIGVGATGSNGTVTFNDGGTAVFNVAVVGGTSDVAMNIPEQGVLFKANLNVTTVNCTVNVFYTG